MTYKKIIPFMNAAETDPDLLEELAVRYSNQGADELFFYDYTGDDKHTENFLAGLKQLAAKIDIPFMAGVPAHRFEDVKKAFYCGADCVVIKNELTANRELIKEAVGRFGRDHIAIELNDKKEMRDELLSELEEDGSPILLVKHLDFNAGMKERLENCGFSLILRDSLRNNRMEDLLSLQNVLGLSTDAFADRDIMAVKQTLVQSGIAVNTFASSENFADFTTNADGLVPCIVQDYRTGEALMLAYMNAESFRKTIETGRMTYYSRSRQCLWLKGETSGHYQYLKELRVDCDKDTLLAKVNQIGAACHTGNYSCFYTELMKRSADASNPLTIFHDVYDTILDRKAHPKEGSYTNYLFDKGLDKILKKCGEESTEVIIAAKNPDPDELKYEISDYLYHLMVLMAERGLDWNDIVKELSNRH